MRIVLIDRNTEEIVHEETDVNNDNAPVRGCAWNDENGFTWDIVEVETFGDQMFVQVLSTDVGWEGGR